MPRPPPAPLHPILTLRPLLGPTPPSIIFCEAVAIYGVIVAIILQTKLENVSIEEGLYSRGNMAAGYAIFAAGLTCGLANLVCGCDPAPCGGWGKRTSAC